MSGLKNLRRRFRKPRCACMVFNEFTGETNFKWPEPVRSAEGNHHKRSCPLHRGDVASFDCVCESMPKGFGEEDRIYRGPHHFGKLFCSRYQSQHECTCGADLAGDKSRSVAHEMTCWAVVGWYKEAQHSQPSEPSPKIVVATTRDGKLEDSVGRLKTLHDIHTSQLFWDDEK